MKRLEGQSCSESYGSSLKWTVLGQSRRSEGVTDFHRQSGWSKGMNVDGPKIRKWTVFSKGLFRLRVYMRLYFDRKFDSLDSSLSYSWSTFAYNLIFWTVHFQTSGPSSWPRTVHLVSKDQYGRKQTNLKCQSRRS